MSYSWRNSSSFSMKYSGSDYHALRSTCERKCLVTSSRIFRAPSCLFYSSTRSLVGIGTSSTYLYNSLAYAICGSRFLNLTGETRMPMPSE